MARTKEDDTVAVALLNKSGLRAFKRISQTGSLTLGRNARSALSHATVVDLSKGLTVEDRTTQSGEPERENDMLNDIEKEILLLLPLAVEELDTAIEHFENAATIERQTTEKYRQMTEKKQVAIKRMQKILGR